MSKTKQVLILAIIVAAVIAGRAIPINPFADSSVQANQGEKSGIQKWEYCAITDVSYVEDTFNGRTSAVIRYFQAGGVKEEIVEFVSDIKKRSIYSYTNGALAKAMAKLGDEGWELVSKESDTDRNVKPFYFKRPKQ